MIFIPGVPLNDFTVVKHCAIDAGDKSKKVDTALNLFHMLRGSSVLPSYVAFFCNSCYSSGLN